MLIARKLQHAVGTLAALMLASNTAMAQPVRIGVSDRVYQDLAQQIGGPAVTVTLLPHTVASSPLPQLDIVIRGGSRSDAWLEKAAKRMPSPAFVIDVSPQSAAHRSGAEPPWYDVPTIARYSHALAEELTRRMPSEASRIASNTARTMAAFEALDRRIDEIEKVYANSDVFLGDDLFRKMASRLRFKIRNEDYLKALRRGVPAAAQAVARLKQAIQQRSASIFIYDKDADGAAVQELVAAANEVGIPVVALREQPPKGSHYQQWMMRQINAVHGALNEASP